MVITFDTFDTFDTFGNADDPSSNSNAKDPSSNFVGIATAEGGSTFTYAATSTTVPACARDRTPWPSPSPAGPSPCGWMDGRQVLRVTVASLPPAALLAYTAATGVKTDVHTVRDTVITATSYAAPPPATRR